MTNNVRTVAFFTVSTAGDMDFSGYFSKADGLDMVHTLRNLIVVLDNVRLEVEKVTVAYSVGDEEPVVVIAGEDFYSARERLFDLLEAEAEGACI